MSIPALLLLGVLLFVNFYRFFDFGVILRHILRIEYQVSFRVTGFWQDRRCDAVKDIHAIIGTVKEILTIFYSSHFLLPFGSLIECSGILIIDLLQCTIDFFHRLYVWTIMPAHIIGRYKNLRFVFEI